MNARRGSCDYEAESKSDDSTVESRDARPSPIPSAEAPNHERTRGVFVREVCNSVRARNNDGRCNNRERDRWEPSTVAGNVSNVVLGW